MKKAVAFSLTVIAFSLLFAMLSFAAEDTVCTISALDTSHYASCYGSHTVTAYSGDSAVAAGVPTGYSDTVWKIEGGYNTNGQNRGALLDFTAAQIPAAEVKSITFRIYTSAGNTASSSYPELRIEKPNTSSDWVMRYNIADKEGQWTEVVLDASSFMSGKSFADLTNDGLCLDKFELSLRQDEMADYYIDSVTVQRLAKQTDDNVLCAFLKPSEVEGHVVANDSQTVRMLTAAQAQEAGLPEGYSGSVWEVSGGVSGAGVGVVLDFTSQKIPIDTVNSITFRVLVYDTENTTDAYPEIRISKPGSGKNAWVMRREVSEYAGQWVDITLTPDTCYGSTTMQDLAVDGYLAKFELDNRNNADFAMYIDSVTVDYDSFNAEVPYAPYAFYGAKSVTKMTFSEAQTAGVPAGYTGSVWSVAGRDEYKDGCGALIDLSALKIPADRVNSITFRVYLGKEDNTSYPQLRIKYDNASKWMLYTGEKTPDGEWTDFVLDSSNIHKNTAGIGFSAIANENGYLDKFELSARHTVASSAFYIDDITIDWEPEVESEYTFCDYSVTSADDFYATYGATAVREITSAQAAKEGIPAGYSGNVLVVEGRNDRGVLLDFTPYEIPYNIIESLTFRVYMGYSGSNGGDYPYLRIRKAPLPFRRWVVFKHMINYANTWVDITLDKDNISGNFYQAPGYFRSLAVDGMLHKFELSMRNDAYDPFYIDAITMKVAENEGVAPILTYNGADTVYTSEGAKFSVDATAFDEREMRNVSVKYVWSDNTLFLEDGTLGEGTYTCTLTASDYYGNKAEKAITVVVGAPDTEVPVINFPLEEVNVRVGTYPMDNFSVSDNGQKADVTCQWSEGAVGIDGRLTEGTHTLTVTATDMSGNISQKVITFNVTDEVEEPSRVIDEEKLCTSATGAALGAQIRTEEPQGLRFGYRLDYANDNMSDIASYDGQDDSSYCGILIIPTASLEGELVHSSGGCADVKAEILYSEDVGGAVFTAVVTDIPEEKSDMSFTARGYICIGGEYTYFDCISRSVNSVKDLSGWDK